jgi:outer membrane lipoprotein-sorting protein
VSELGDLLELLHGARGRVATVRAVVRIWQDPIQAQEAFRRHVEASGGTTVTWYAGDGQGDVPAEIETEVRFWLNPPDLVREERDDPHGSSVGVRRGATWWQSDDTSGATTNDGDPHFQSGIGDTAEQLLNPAWMISGLDVDDIARGRWAGRPTVSVRAVPRVASGVEPGGPPGSHTWGADELRLEVDARRGTLLRVESRFAGRPIAVPEVVEIAFDETFDDALFTFEAPPGEHVVSAAERFARPEYLPIDEAVRRAPFAVWVPERLPEDWELQVTFVPASERPPVAPQIHVTCRPPSATHGVSVVQARAGERGVEFDDVGPGEWRDLARGGRAMRVRAPVEDWQPASVELELEGTRILLRSSNVSADALADLAVGLVRAPSAPPSFPA